MQKKRDEERSVDELTELESDLQKIKRQQKRK